MSPIQYQNITHIINPDGVGRMFTLLVQKTKPDATKTFCVAPLKHVVVIQLCCQANWSEISRKQYTSCTTFYRYIIPGQRIVQQENGKGPSI